MTLWTVQHIDAYNPPFPLRATTSYAMFPEAYAWMSEQLAQRVGPPPAGVKYPIWAWYQWEGKRKRCDLRCSGYAERGTPMVQLTLEVPSPIVLLSDFDAWHSVLNNSYDANNEEDFDTFNGTQEDIQRSWERCFDLQRHTPGWDFAPEEKSIQAVLWEVHPGWIKKAEYFIAK